MGVEDPFGGELPLAVLAISDKGCATSSTRLRHWRAGGHDAHHLIDPATGRPGGIGLVAVTVVDDDPTRAEVDTKHLFLGGADEIAQSAQDRRIAALWVGADGEVANSPAMEPFVIWRA